MTANLDAVARELHAHQLRPLNLTEATLAAEWAAVAADPDRIADARQHAAYIVGLVQQGTTPAGDPPHRDALWRIVDWALWGAGCDDLIREHAADLMVAALPADLRAQIVEIEDQWRRHRLGGDGHPAHAELVALREAAEQMQAVLERQNAASGLLPDVLAVRRALAAALEMRPKSKYAFAAPVEG